MSPTTRQTRRQATLAALAEASPSSSANTVAAVNQFAATPGASSIALLPSNLTRQHTKLSSKAHSLLLRKRTWLKSHTLSNNLPHTVQRAWGADLTPTISAVLIFAQEEAGTAVSVSPDGVLLTCSHCIAETKEELDLTASHWLLFGSSGAAVEAKCTAWDPIRDLALLRIVAMQREDGESGSLPYIALAPSAPSPGARLVCIGQPGSEDLEASLPGVKTGYDLLHLSMGKFRGYAEGQDPEDNSEIGALMHDCWTYWGHSGAPLIELSTRRLVGLHSSWDDETAMRRAIPVEAIRSVLVTNGIGRLDR